MHTTDELRSAIRSSSDPALLADGAFSPPDYPVYLCSLLERRGWLVRDAIRACYLERSYGYQLFNGTRPPTRTFLLRLALALELGEEVLEDPSSYTYYMGDSTGGAAWGDVSDLSLLASMPNLKELWLCRQQISDLSPLEGLPITRLVLCDNQIEDLSPLSSLTSLNTLWLGGNAPSDLTPLAGLTRLRDLNLDGVDDSGQLTPLDSLAPLTELPLTRLSLGGRTVSDGDWSVLGALPLLEEVSLWAPPEEAVAALCGRDRLPILNVGLLPCEDLSILAGCPVVDLRLHSGQVSLEGAGGLPRLRNLGLFSSRVTDLSPLAQADLLETFCFTGPAVPDFSPLAGLPRLNLVLVPQSMTAAAELACPGRVSLLG